MTGVLRLSNQGERTFYVYKDGEVVANWDKKIDPEYNDELGILG